MDASISISNEVNEAEVNVAPLAPFSCLLAADAASKAVIAFIPCQGNRTKAKDAGKQKSWRPNSVCGRLERLLNSSQEGRASSVKSSHHAHNTLATVTASSASQEEDAIVRLGLFEEAPPRQLIETLMNIYFNRIHQVTPLLHRQRFMASLFMPDPMKPPMCLQYIVMASAAETSEAYHRLGMIFYKRAVKYLQNDDLGVDFARSGREQHVDWIGVEERRRTWWTIFCYDRFTCATTGWPALIHNHNIRTRLPASDKAYEKGQEEHTRFLGDQLLESEQHSTFAGAVLAAHIFHRTIEHTATNNSQDQEDRAFNGDLYWQRHKGIDNDLKFMLLMLPNNLCLPANYKTHNAIFVNIMLQTATICLHRAALWRMKSNLQGLPNYQIRLTQDRLLPAAEEILNIFKIIPDLGATFTNPLICFAAYMAALVFMANTSPIEPDGEHGQNLDFILKILAVFGNTNLVANALANEIAKEMKQCGITSPSMNKPEYAKNQG
ncbi:Zn(II)2Cys6 transcriptional activator [Fusarium sp. NRRL 52700]|nr:Zn(II)2Cys6 transcriptional activator [Fusarium sp. NRRL 52700]